jgi:hypothetical protein
VEDPGRASIEVILAGNGERARAWGALLARSTVAQVVARVARSPVVAGADAGPPWFSRLEEALSAFPSARVALALPPRAGLEAALALAHAGRVGVVEAPLHASLARAALPAGARSVAVAHGWVTLPARTWFARALTDRSAREVTIEARGLPEEAGGETEEVLTHALALALRLFPGARVESALERHEALLELVLSTGAGPLVRVRARSDGQGLELRAVGPGFELGFRAEKDQETIASRAGASPRQERTRTVAPAAVRALHQLVDPAAAGGDTLEHAQAVARLVGEVSRALRHRFALGSRALRASARIGAARPDALLAQLGLSGAFPVATPAPTLRVHTPPEPLELWPFRAGRKPVAFLTVRPGEVESVLATFGAAHVERRERRVQIGPQDAWLDRRDLGDARVELYLSADADLAARAARLQTEGDPSASLREIGALMGYPPCCVEAFHAQTDRHNNTRNRYATAARTLGGAPWPWELSNLHTMLIPCYPCSYTCAAARDLAASALAAMESAHPGTRDALRGALARTTLYFDHERQVLLGGEARGDTVHYSSVCVPEGTAPAFAAFAGALAAGDELTLGDEALVVRSAGRELFTLRRTDPGLGFLAPFG